MLNNGLTPNRGHFWAICGPNFDPKCSAGPGPAQGGDRVLIGARSAPAVGL
jgi:hypothetical protein